jgi:hypothetical protein
MAFNRRWAWIAVIYFVINVGGLASAVARAEWMHAMLHAAALAGAGAYLWWRTGNPRASSLPQSTDVDRQLVQLQQSLDAIAHEVSRVEESQLETARQISRQNDRKEQV